MRFLSIFFFFFLTFSQLCKWILTFIVPCLCLPKTTTNFIHTKFQFNSFNVERKILTIFVPVHHTQINLDWFGSSWMFYFFFQFGYKLMFFSWNLLWTVEYSNQLISYMRFVSWTKKKWARGDFILCAVYYGLIQWRWKWIDKSVFVCFSFHIFSVYIFSQNDSNMTNCSCEWRSNVIIQMSWQYQSISMVCLLVICHDYESLFLVVVLICSNSTLLSI